MNGRYERELANKLHEQGFEVIRAPASGAATKRSLPDIAYSKSETTPVFVELKSTSENVAYYDEDEVKALQEFALAFSGRARLVARFKQDTAYYSAKVENARRTDTDRYAVDRGIDTEIIA